MENRGKTLMIKEQVYKDATGITFQFLVREDAESPYKILLICDDLPFGNREISINRDGLISGAGTVVTSGED